MALTRMRPFPWGSLETTTRAEVSALRHMKHWIANHVRLDGLGAALAELLGTDVELHIGRARPLATSSAIQDGVAVVIASAEAANVTGGALIEVEAALAANVVARALRRPPPALLSAAAAPSAGIAGAFAAVVIAAARRAHGDVSMRVLGAGPSAVLEADFAHFDPERWALSFTVLLGRHAFAARAVVPREGARTSTIGPWNAAALAALGGTPLTLPIVVCATHASAAELSALRAGDALVPIPNGPRFSSSSTTNGRNPRSGWPLTRGSGGRPTGPVMLAPPSFDLGVLAHLSEDGRIVLRGGLEPLLPEAHMASEENDAVIAALGEVPVVVRVEIGEAVMAARDWALIGRGDVITLGRPPGEAVLLRVGGFPMARGELVELDGEVAVRIVERFIGERTTP